MLKSAISFFQQSSSSMTRRLLLLWFLMLPFAAFAQRLNHPLSAAGGSARRTPQMFQAVAETVSVLAVRVQFRTDSDSRTTGNGTFSLTAGPADTVLDAPPHDSQYFRAHLQFLGNYFRRVSKGRVIVKTTLLDSVVTLPSQMQSYSPPRGGTNLPVANLARDTWHAVDSLNLVPDFHAYQSFVVFHAGSGRDIDLVSELGYDPTPYDIPSLYFGLSGFRAVFGSSFQGIPVQGGSFYITNSMVIPETESRLLPGAVGDVPLVLGINGLLCASLGNFLGLPDLFDTQTGASGIGRFGLMDGQAIFSFSGAFPPEPSAWEKYWLGWIATPVVGVGDTTLSLPAVALADTAYRVPISSEEYFLVENRSRDPFGTGITVTTLYQGSVRQQSFTRDTIGFNEFDLSLIKGTVTDVTVPDWSLPGETDPDGSFYNGGALIWHIDESVIAQGISSDAVNANPDHRGVSVMEADGAQDIGRSYGLFTAGSGSEQGTVLDFWFAGNIAPLYKNQFSPTTLPSSASYAGANSHISIGDFSQRSPHMTFTVQRGDAQVSPLPGYPRISGYVPALRAPVVPDAGTGSPSFFVAYTGTPAATSQVNQLAVQGPGGVFGWTPNGTPALVGGRADGMVVRLQVGDDVVFGPLAGAFGDPATQRLVIAVNSTTPGRTGIRDYSLKPDGTSDSLATETFFRPLGKNIVTPLVASDSLIAVGVEGGLVYFLRFDGSVADSVRPSGDSTAAVLGVSALPLPYRFLITMSDGTIAVTGSVPVMTTGGGFVTQRIADPIAGPGVSMGGSSASDPPRIAFATTSGNLYLDDLALHVVSGFPIATGGAITQPPAFADIDGDGTRDIVVFSGGRVCAYHTDGASVDYFPATLSSSSPIVSAPVIADVDGDGRSEVVAATSDGLIGAFTRQGKMAPGFPLSAGRGRQDIAVVRLSAGAAGPGKALIAVSSEDGGVHAWKTYAGGDTTRDPWPQYQYDALHSGQLVSAPAGGVPQSSEFMPKDRAYNWPNPVYSAKTSIRYFVSQSATVHIKIFTLTGDLVTELDGPGVGGLDNEVTWDVTGVQSGIYLARVEADGPSSSQVRIIKIAVVR